MDVVVYGLVGLAIGVVLAWLYLRVRYQAAPTSSQQHEGELKAILDEVRELRLEIDILKVNPTIGDAVKAALKHAQEQPDFQKSAYDVLVRASKLPASAYNVAAKPGRISEGEGST